MHVDKSLVEASNRTAIHLVVLPAAAVHLEGCGFVTMGIGVGKPWQKAGQSTLSAITG